MSTDAGRRGDGPRRARALRRRWRSYLIAFAAVLGALVLVGAGTAAVGALQGPRVTQVQFDPQAAVSASGSRLILTTSQSLAPVDPAQVTVSPAADATVETSGRSVGLRFALPLRDDTDYTVTIEGVTGVGGGPAATLTYQVHTPALQVYLLQRAGAGSTFGEDTVVRSGLDGANPVPVFQAAHIEDFRATGSHLVMSLRTDDGPQLVVTDLDGQDARSLPLPGRGTVQELQTADRGEVIGYTYTDVDMTAAGAQASVLYTASLKDADAETPPTAIEVSGSPVSVAQWRFVPDTDSVLLLSFQGRLLLGSSSGKDPVDLGSAAQIEGIARGSTIAYVQRADGIYEIDLTDGTDSRLTDAVGADGFLGGITPLPGNASLRQYTVAGAGSGGTALYRVAADGAATAVFTATGTTALLHTCVSPSGRYAAVLVQPDAASNPYVTGYDMPLPKRVETHIVDLDTGAEVSMIAAFDISWCQVPLR